MKRALLLFPFSAFVLFTGCGHMRPAYPTAEYPAPTAKFCRVLEDWKTGGYTPESLCNRYSGNFCAMTKTPGQAICAANNKIFCTDVTTLGEGICQAGVDARRDCAGIKTTAAGICSALKGSFCKGETDKHIWNDRLANACKWNSRTTARQ